MMEMEGLVSPAAGGKAREVLVDKQYFDEVDAQLQMITPAARERRSCRVGDPLRALRPPRCGPTPLILARTSRRLLREPDGRRNRCQHRAIAAGRPCSRTSEPSSPRIRPSCRRYPGQRLQRRCAVARRPALARCVQPVSARQRDRDAGIRLLQRARATDTQAAARQAVVASRAASPFRSAGRRLSSPGRATLHGCASTRRRVGATLRDRSRTIKAHHAATVLPDVVRIIIELDREVPFHDERIADPDRVFDRSAVAREPRLAPSIRRSASTVIPMSSARSGSRRHENGTTRVVLDAGRRGQLQRLSALQPLPARHRLRRGPRAPCLRPLVGQPPLTTWRAEASIERPARGCAYTRGEHVSPGRSRRVGWRPSRPARRCPDGPRRELPAASRWRVSSASASRGS